jgi:hypothetical protein
MSQYIKVDSNLRIDAATTSPADCVIPSDHVMGGCYQLKSVTLPATNFNLNSSNNVVYFNENDGALKTCVIPIGYYSGFADVANALALSMSAAGTGTYTCSVSSLNNRLTVNSTVNFKFLFGSNSLNSASIVLGFVNNSASSATSQTGSQIMNTSITTNYNFIISDASSSIKTLDGKSFTFSVPPLSATPNLIYFEPSERFPITFRFEATRNLKIKIVDDKQRVIPNLNSDWTLTLERKS